MKLRDKILQSVDLEEELVAVPEWDCEILVRGMTGDKRSKLISECVKVNSRTKQTKTDLDKMYPIMIIECSLDPETKERIFSDEDRDALSKKSAKALDRVFKKASALSGLEDEIEEQEKNF